MKFILGIMIIFFGVYWQGCEKAGETDQEYVDQINQWHQKRVERLTSPTGWMSLAGLYWLRKGENTFGADSTNDIIFPAKAPGFIGSFILKDDHITVKILSDAKILHDDKPIKEIEMTADVDGDPTLLSYGTLSWYIIKRSNDFGVRLRDSANPNIESFHGIERYPVDPVWRLEATFEAYNPQTSISIPTILGTIDEKPCPGALAFEIRNKTYRLDVLSEGDQFFVIFGDETNKDETYESGRYVYVNEPGSDEKTIIDFNKAYNPPCAFTNFATCPFPPEQNILSVKITAGEKRYH